MQGASCFEAECIVYLHKITSNIIISDTHRFYEEKIVKSRDIDLKIEKNDIIKMNKIILVKL
ncbi:hypothetical protein DP149_00370 [Clostridium tetani]|uniref:hypothetical protein n=1 Tax=Clostridium tetani TaxID=1513 RepID=UPI000310EB27|nr:hypothetical protein [Clostridium tetani]AVP55676.1 hypothetical protein C3B72_11210 [Clostridium tetani]KGI36508.1 hypothetical protein KY52_13565 [Clostridium tetani]KGI38811.1 hypothetical protein LA33_08905 [Clostridium tetani ATCC 9441]KGI42588.1 hypothetical protein KY54_13005 [Clostridium tetani]KGI43495.1 hypothetical protein KY55_06695 [Clostridium tetani]